MRTTRYRDHRHQQRRPALQQTFADYLCGSLGWESVYAYNVETFGPNSSLGRASERDVVLARGPASRARSAQPGHP